MVRRSACTLAALLSAFAAAGAPGDHLTVEKTACFGTCPARTLSLFPDDRYRWHGLYAVQAKGDARGSLPRGTYDAALARVRAVRYREFRGRYTMPGDCDEWWTDHPSTALTVVTGEGRKAIAHYHGCSGFDREVELLALEASLDRLLHLREIDGAAPARREDD